MRTAICEVLYERDEARWVLIRLIGKYQAAEAD
jgi:hypothetical protein